MMRNWFILFATTFTITTLVVSISTLFVPLMSEFDYKYVFHLAISSTLLSLYIHLIYKIPIQSNLVNILLDVTVILAIVYITGYYVHLYPNHIYSFILVFVLVIVIYSIITLIYHFILTKEAEQMNGKIEEWRNKHVGNQPYK